jgi:hypothetical protein
MGDKAETAHWYFREGGIVTTASWDVADPSPMLRANAYQKAARGEALTDDEHAAVEAARGQPLAHTVLGNLAGDVGLGFLFTQAPELVQQLDDLVGQWAERLGLADFAAWQLAADYTVRALAATMDEARIGDEESAIRHLERDGETPERISDWRGGGAAVVAVAAAWATSPEGQAAAAAMAPDGGPEGWSQVPPANPDHGCHPSKRKAVQ